MGVKKFHKVMSTLHRNCVSRKKVFIVARIMPIPRENIIKNSMATGNRSMLFCSGMPDKRMMTSMGMVEMQRLIAEERILDKGKIYLGI